MEKRIKKIREFFGLTQSEFAEKAGLSRRTVQMYEKDASSILFSRAHDIARVFGISIEWLLLGQGEMIKPVEQNLSDNTVDKFDPVNKVHIKIDKNYEDHETALLANEYLMNIEKKSPKDFLLAVGYLKGVSDSIDRKSQDQTDRRKRTMAWESPERRKKTAS